MSRFRVLSSLLAPPPLLTSILSIIAFGLAGCSYGGSGPPAPHYSQFKAEMPEGNTVTVCSAHGCRHKTRFTFSRRDIAKLRAIMDRARRDGSPAGERRAIRKAIAWMEDRVGRETGTAADRAGLDFLGAGDPTQMDCVDEATNTTSYLLILQSHGLLKYHTVGIPMTKGDLLKATLQGDPVKYWPHWTAVIQETKTGQRFAVDSWIYANGENPAVVEVEKWYIKDIDNLPKATN